MEAQPRYRFHTAASWPCFLPSHACTTYKAPAPKQNDVKSLGWVLNTHKYHSCEPSLYLVLQFYFVLQQNEHRAGLSQPTMNACAVGIKLTLLLLASGYLKPLVNCTLNSTIRCVNANVLVLKLINQLTTSHIKSLH